MAGTILITGASSGLGQELAKAFKKRDVHVIGIGARDYQDNASEFDAIDTYIQADFCKPEVACDVILKKLREKEINKIDFLIHNAATGYYGDFPEQTTESIEAILNVNLVTPILLTKHLLPYLQHSRMLFVSSVISGLSAPQCMIYTATKSALESFASNLKLELSCYSDVSLCQLGAMRTALHQRVGFHVDAKRIARFADPKQVAEEIEQALCKRQAFSPPLKDRLIISSGVTLRMLRLLAGIAPNVMAFERIKPGQRVAITGAVQGIGLSLAKEFARMNCELVLIDKDLEGLKQTKATLARITNSEIATVGCDLSRTQDAIELTKELKSKHDGIDLFIHNAGINHAGIFGLQKDRPLLETLKVNLFAPILMTHQLISHHLINKGGGVVFVSSLSHYVGYPGSSVYAATKDGLQSFASGLGRSASQLKTATVFPGPTDTAQARANAPLSNMEDRSKKRMKSERVAMTVVRALNNRRSTIIPGGANRFLAFLGVVFPGMTRSVLKSSLFKKMMFEQLNLQIQGFQNDSESERWKCLPEQSYDKGVQKNHLRYSHGTGGRVHSLRRKQSDLTS